MSKTPKTTFPDKARKLGTRLLNAAAEMHFNAQPADADLLTFVLWSEVIGKKAQRKGIDLGELTVAIRGLVKASEAEEKP